MDHMEYSIALPQCVELSNAGAEWTTMKQRLFIHLNPNLSSFHHLSPSLSTAFLINISLDQVQEIFNRYGLSIDETVRFNEVLKSIEDLCLPRFLIIYNRYRFFTCKQNGPEFNGFLQQLLAWSDLCEFGDLKDILLKDCIISGISEESVRQHLLRTEQLDFNKTVEICRAGLVKKHGSENPKSKEISFKDTWTLTENLLLSQEDSVSKLEKMDEATNTNDGRRCEKGTQTDHINVSDACCEVIEERDLTDHLRIVSSLIVNDCINTDISDCPSFVNDNDTLYSQNDVDLSHKEKDKDVFHVAKKNVQFCLKTKPINASNARCLNRRETRGGKTGTEEKRYSRNDSSCSVNSNRQLEHSPKGSSSFHEEDHFQNNQEMYSDFETTLKCRVCNMLFTDTVSLKSHKENHKTKREEKFKCKSCSSSFYTTACLKADSFLHTGEHPFVCDICGKGYAEASKLKSHARNHTGERPYKCPDCHLTFKWSAAFNRHRRTHTGEKPYICKKCSASFADLTSLQRHIRIHSKDRPFQCMCGSSFTDPSALRVHKRIHTGEKPFSCSICNSLFIRAQHLKEHMKLHSGVKPYECETCHAKFSEASKLKSHLRRHTGERPYVCKICARSFSWTAAYNRHLRTHTMEKPYVCRICGSTFADNSSLARHHRIHTGERPYHCTKCASTFADSSSLSRHQKIHTGEKAYICDFCGASFTLKSYLTRHFRIHTGEKSFECNVCSVKFSDSSKLNRHKKIHTRALVKHEKGKAVSLWPTAVDADPLLSESANPDLTQLHEQDIGQYLFKTFQFDPSQGRNGHDFEDIPLDKSVVDAILTDIKS